MGIVSADRIKVRERATERHDIGVISACRRSDRNLYSGRAMLPDRFLGALNDLQGNAGDRSSLAIRQAVLPMVIGEKKSGFMMCLEMGQVSGRA